MTDPDDTEWLLARERGEDVSHVPAELRAKYDRLGSMIEALPDHAPSPGWRQRVLDALGAPGGPGALEAPRASGPLDAIAGTDATAPQTPRATDTPAVHTIATRRRTWAIAGSGAAAASVILAIALRGGGDGITEPIVTAEVRHGDHQHRGDVSIGDTLVVHADADHPIELRVYGDTGEPIARCGETGGCTVVREGARRRYTLEVALQAPGDVRAVLFTVLDAALPPPRDLDADLGAAHDAHVETRQVAIVHVR